MTKDSIGRVLNHLVDHKIDIERLWFIAYEVIKESKAGFKLD